MAYNSLLYNVENRIATLTLNRPDRFNAFNEELSYELMDGLKQARKDPEARVIVITGAGDKAFCSGQDLKDIAGQKRSLGESVEKRYAPLVRLMQSIEKPIIARVNGVAAGAGAGLVMAADLSVASENASLVFAFINIGLVPDTGSSWQLAKRLPPHKAFEIATRGDRINAQEALGLNLLNRVVPHDKLDEEVNALAAHYADKPPVALMLTKKMLHKGATATLDEMLLLEQYYQEIAGNTEDYAEGVNAFVEKRKAEFKGR